MSPYTVPCLLPSSNQEGKSPGAVAEKRSEGQSAVHASPAASGNVTLQTHSDAP